VNAPYSSKALPQGALLREWRLEGVLGVGGFGIVYRGRGTYFGETVAIKEYFPSAISDRVDGETVKPADSSSEEVYALGLRKFLEEAKILWQLSQPERHPHIVSVRSLFEIHGTAYMVMDFETGASLSRMLREGVRFDEPSLIAILRPIAEGLERAHRAGVIHRDIKPANILVDDDGRSVLIDFGSARFETNDATSTTVTFHTPPYAALEQYVKTYQQGPWTDIYALGVVAYQCVTGEKPPEALERLHGEAGEPLSAREWPGFSATFTRAVDAAMAMRPQERPQSISEWLKWLDGDLPGREDDDDTTRLVVTKPSKPQASVSVEAAPPAPMAAEAAPIAETSPEPPPPASEPAPAPSFAPTPRPGRAAPRPGFLGRGVRFAGMAVIASLAALGIAAVVVLFRLSGMNKPVPSQAVLPIVHAAQALGISPGSMDTAAVAQVATAAQGLLQDAKAAGRPAAEISSLSAAAAEVAALPAELRALPATPEGRNQAQSVAARANELAKSMARAEAAALERSARTPLKEVDRVLGSGKAGSPEATRAAAAVRAARARLAAAAAAVSSAAGGPAALQAARSALGAYGEFAGAYASAKTYYAPARRVEFTALKGRIEGMADRVAAAAAQRPPGLFASGERKQAYQRLKDAETQARSQRAQLDQLSHTVATSSDLAQIDDAIRQAATLQQSMSTLYETATAAAEAAK
jgi:serine/threonine protein kinase